MRILIIEDEKSIADALLETLKRNGYLVDICYDGKSGLDYALSNIYDLLIIDLMLPGINGLALIKEIRKADLETKIIILSAKSEEDTKVLGLTLGADDYVTKPFFPKELVARVNAALRRKKETIQKPLEFHGLKYDLKTSVLSFKDKTIKLKGKEAYIMEELLKAKGTLISKETLFDKIWGFDNDSDYNAVEVYISFLRKKIKHLSSDVELNVQRGLGYYLEKSYD